MDSECHLYPHHVVTLYVLFVCGQIVKVTGDVVATWQNSVNLQEMPIILVLVAMV